MKVLYYKNSTLMHCNFNALMPIDAKYLTLKCTLKPSVSNLVVKFLQKKITNRKISFKAISI